MSGVHNHPVLGQTLGLDVLTTKHGTIPCLVYTRTIVLWALNVSIDTLQLWDNVVVLGVDNREVWHAQPTPTTHHGPPPPPTTFDYSDDSASRHTASHNPPPPAHLRRLPRSFDPHGPQTRHPVVRMLSTSTHRRGNLDKRMQSAPFRSVLSMDIEYRGAMPNLKISNRNTIQATGCQNMEVLSEILAFLVTTYRGRGFHPAPGSRPVAFVGDIVLANVHFHLGWRIDRTRLRDVMNGVARGDFVASYEPLVHDVSVSIKHFEDAPLPNDGAVYPLWTHNTDTSGGSWTTVRYQDVLQLVPHATIRRRPRCHTFRVFATGSVVQVGRWPGSMRQVYDHFVRYMVAVRARVIDRGTKRQRTIDDCWPEAKGTKHRKHTRPDPTPSHGTECTQQPHHHQIHPAPGARDGRASATVTHTLGGSPLRGGTGAPLPRMDRARGQARVLLAPASEQGAPARSHSCQRHNHHGQSCATVGGCTAPRAASHCWHG